jgi:integrase
VDRPPAATCHPAEHSPAKYRPLLRSTRMGPRYGAESPRPGNDRVAQRLLVRLIEELTVAEAWSLEGNSGHGSGIGRSRASRSAGAIGGPREGSERAGLGCSWKSPEVRASGTVRLQIVPAIGKVKLAQLCPHHVEGVLDRMTDAAPATVHKTHRVLHAALAQAVRWQILGANPASGIRPPKADRGELNVPEAVEVRKLLKAAEETVYHLPLLLAATTGMRRGEVLGLHWDTVDLGAGELQIVTTLQRIRRETVFIPPKTERSRRKISLPPVTVDALRAHRKAQSERRLLLGEAWVDLGLGVDRGDGEHLDPDTLSAGFRRAAVATGLEGVRLHDLRHAFASTLLDAGVNVKVVSEALGHRSTAFTMDTYAHLLPTMGAHAAAAIQDALG